MTRPRATLLLAALLSLFCLSLKAQGEAAWEISAPGGVSYDLETGFGIATNATIIYDGTVLTADTVSANDRTLEVVADGNVRIQQGDEVWVGEHIQYNFKTRQMVTSRFRTGRPPVFAGGEGLHGDITNQTYTATNALITTDNVSRPAIEIRARRIRVIPGKRIEARDATLWLYGVPAFYFPYYSRNLSERANNFNFIPGYRTRYGPFLLNSYTWFLNDQLDGAIHLDYREKRGVGVGPDLNFHLGRWGDAAFRYYYTHDEDARTNALNAPVYENRQRLYFSYLASPFTNLEVRSLVRYQSDIGVLHDFFESEYRQDPQPNSYVEANRFWRNFSLDALAQPRVNDFYERIERLPELRLTGFRQQLGTSPLYYESESTAGYYHRWFAETNGPVPPDFAAARVDTYHQLLLPETLFGWLSITPRAGGRFTYYSQATGPGATTEEVYRGVFNTGAEISFKASRLWPGVRSRALELDGLRHIIKPSANYVYVPRPTSLPSQLPQFDYQLPSLRLLPIEFPQYNSIDSIDSENAIRFGLRNEIQTRRAGRIEALLDWDVQTDWRLQPNRNQPKFSDVYSDLTFRPRSWLTLQSQVRLDPNTGRWRMVLDTVTFQPNETWNWTIGNFYLRDEPYGSSLTALGPGNNVINSSFYFRLNENWGLRATHHFDVRNGRMQEQYYTVYRDMRSWTAALTGGVRDNGVGPRDYIIGFTFSIKAMPKFGLGGDTVRSQSLLGGGG